jgi:hypothetical protein
MMGKPGSWISSLNYLKVGDTKVHLRGTQGQARAVRDHWCRGADGALWPDRAHQAWQEY